MTAARWNPIIEQGVTFTRVLTWKDSNGTPIDLTGYTARMQLRKTIESSVAAVSLTTENGGIDLGDAAGTITITIAATATANLIESEYAYDLELISGSIVKRPVQGKITISKEVTR